MTIKKIGVISLGKTMGAFYGGLGLIFGLIITLFALMGAAIGAAGGNNDAFLGMFFGVGAVIIVPLLYGAFGFIGGVITAFVFNLVSSCTGGLEIEVDGFAAPAVASSYPQTLPQTSYVPPSTGQPSNPYKPPSNV